MYNIAEYKPAFITNSTTSAVFTGKGILHAIVVNSTTGTPFAVFDSAVNAATGTIAILKSSIAENTYLFDATVANGLYITCGVSGNYTVLYTK